MESKRQPEKLEAKRQQLMLQDVRRDVIEDVVTEMLATNKAITSAKQV